MFKKATITNSHPLILFFIPIQSVSLTLSYFLSLALCFLFCSNASSSSSSSLHCLLRAIGKFVSSSVLLLYHWFLYFFGFSYLFLFCHCSKVTTVSLSSTLVFGFSLCPIRSVAVVVKIVVVFKPFCTSHDQF